VSRRNIRKGYRQQTRWLIGGVLIIIAVAAGLIALSLATNRPSSAQASAAPMPSALDACGGPVCGQATAPVTIEVYADFQCPYCARADIVLQQVASQYIETGKVRLEYNNFPIIGPESQTAAQAAECAADQGKFWSYADYLFANQAAENSGTLTVNHLEQIAATLGLDSSTFNTCLTSGKYASLVQQQYSQGQQRGVTATPTLFINGKKYEGAPTYDQLVADIAAAQPAAQTK